MSSMTLVQDVEKVKESSIPNNLDAKNSGANRSPRSLVPLVRKCGACLGTDFSKTKRKIPRKSSGVGNKTATTNASSVTQSKQCSSKDSSTVSREINSAQVVQNDCRNESKATTPVSASTSPVVRRKGTNADKKQTEGEPKRKQTIQQTTSIEKLPKSSKQLESKAETPQMNLMKQSSKKTSSSPSSKLDKSSVSKRPDSMELKAGPSVKTVSREKAETMASKGKSKVSSDVHSTTTGSYRLFNSRDDDLRIMWDGFEEKFTVGENCCLCEKDLSVQPLENDGGKSELWMLPAAAILACGHVFHDDCVRVLEGDYSDCPVPRCVFCESLD